MHAIVICHYDCMRQVQPKETLDEARNLHESEKSLSRNTNKEE